MKYLLILSLLFIVWIAYEVWRAPQVDENDNVIKPAKKLKDLFK